MKNKLLKVLNLFIDSSETERKSRKFEIFFTITLLIMGLYLMFTEYKAWSSPIIFSVLTFQQSKDYIHFRKSEVEEMNKKAKTSLYIALIFGSLTVLMSAENLYSLLIY